ncbi:hypothetical protein [Criblamydia sequanensis]|uniref:Membrane protein n=1 Tax=Candidatus Criblamydia sequanensis CRIB-18 TaxID=1437425 RepID=A0A090DZD2_9BACT|nr:hypothetical protein [Criblamydia sequanensis]CDR34034.1 putative membrane protein [Criblamydia sequanensis CRIB-18]
MSLEFDFFKAIERLHSSKFKIMPRIIAFISSLLFIPFILFLSITAFLSTLASALFLRKSRWLNRMANDHISWVKKASAYAAAFFISAFSPTLGFSLMMVYFHLHKVRLIDLKLFQTIFEAFVKE